MHGSHAIGKRCEDKGLGTNPSGGKYTMVRYTAVICKGADSEGGGGSASKGCLGEVIFVHPPAPP
jgi:hypothetical protein